MTQLTPEQYFLKEIDRKNKNKVASTQPELINLKQEEDNSRIMKSLKIAGIALVVGLGLALLFRRGKR